MLTETEKAMSSSELRYLIAAQALAQKKPVVKQTDIVNQLRVTKVSAPGTALRTTPTRVHQRLSQNNLRKRQISCETTAELSK